MIRLIAIDLDGTLLTDEKKLPPDFEEVAQYLFSNDIALVIASGRPFHNIASLFSNLRNQLFFVCDNGTYVVHGKQEILVNKLSKEPISKFVEISRGLDLVYPVLCGKNLAYIENTNEDFTRNALKYYQEFKVVDDLTNVDDLILKVSMCDLRGSEENSYPHFKKFETDFSVAVSGEIWLDITKIDGTKGHAIEILQDYLSVSADETLVFGDFLNDLDMIKNAKYSYAMKNAHPKIKEKANFVTELDNNHYGVTATIRKLLSF